MKMKVSTDPTSQPLSVPDLQWLVGELDRLGAPADASVRVQMTVDEKIDSIVVEWDTDESTVRERT